MNADEAAAWRRVLVLEHEAVWTYGLIGARLRDLADAAADAWSEHRSARDQLLERLAAAGARTVGPRAAYDVTLPKDAAAGRAAAADVEERIAAACVHLIGVAGRSERKRAIAWLRRASLATMDWGASVKAFPGMD